MDWIRRNWPDLLIGIALLLVIAGIIATLLSGGSFLPFARNNSSPVTGPIVPTTSTTSTAPTSSNSITDTTSTTDSTTAANSTATIPDTTQPGTTETPTVATETGTTETSSTDTGGTENVIAPVIPDLPTIGEDTSATSTTDATATEATPSTTESTSTAANTEATTSTSTTSNISASSSAAAPYRVGVGAFGSAENAERHASTFRDAGYPVFLGQQGNLSLVLVGPYENRADAEAVQSEIRSSGLQADATIYEFTDGTPAATTSASNSTSTNSTSATSESTSAPTTTSTPDSVTSSPPPTAQSGRYLQVGAYNNIESSIPQRQRLESLGFTVQFIEESNLIKLLVGPYDGDNLSIAESQLTAEGIESFAR